MVENLKKCKMKSIAYPCVIFTHLNTKWHKVESTFVSESDIILQGCVQETALVPFRAVLPSTQGSNPMSHPV